MCLTLLTKTFPRTVMHSYLCEGHRGTALFGHVFGVDAQRHGLFASLAFVHDFLPHLETLFPPRVCAGAARAHRREQGGGFGTGEG